MPYFRTNAVEDKQEQKSGSKAVQGKDVRTLSLQNTSIFSFMFLRKVEGSVPFPVKLGVDSRASHMLEHFISDLSPESSFWHTNLLFCDRALLVQAGLGLGIFLSQDLLNS